MNRILCTTVESSETSDISAKILEKKNVIATYNCGKRSHIIPNGLTACAYVLLSLTPKTWNITDLSKT